VAHRQQHNRIQGSYRWPSSFAAVEASQLLVSSPGWANLVADLRKLYRDLSYKLLHEVPDTTERMAVQNFDRGMLCAIERMIEFEEELKAWKEQTK